MVRDINMEERSELAFQVQSLFVGKPLGVMYHVLLALLAETVVTVCETTDDLEEDIEDVSAVLRDRFSKLQSGEWPLAGQSVRARH